MAARYCWANRSHWPGGIVWLNAFATGDMLQIAKNINGLHIASAEDVAARVHSDHDGNAVVDLGHGDTVTLVGIKAEDVHHDPHGFFKVV